MAAGKTRKIKILWITGLFTVGLFFIFLPAILSSPVVLDLLRQELRSRLAITLELGSCSFGWFRGLEIRNLTCRSPELGVRVIVPRMTGSRGLLALVAAPKNLGVFTLEQPVFQVETRPWTLSPSRSTGQKASGEAVRETGFLPPWDDLLVQLRIIDGAIQPARQPAEPPDRFRLQAALESGTITFSSSVLLALGDGQVVTVRGRVNLPPAHLGLNGDALVIKASVRARHFVLTPLLEQLSRRTGWPVSGDGFLDLDLEYSYSGSRYRLESQARVKQFSLSCRQENILPRSPLEGRLILDGAGGWPGAGLPLEGRLQLESWPGRFWLDLEDFSAFAPMGMDGRCRLGLTMDLERLATILHQGQWLDPEVRLGGRLQMQGTGYLEDGLLVLPQLQLSVEQLVFRDPLDSVEEPRLVVQGGPEVGPGPVVLAVGPLTVAAAMEPWFRAGAGHTAVDLTGHTVYLRGLRVQTSAGTITLDELVFDDWSRFLPGAVQILKEQSDHHQSSALKPVSVAEFQW